MSEHINNVTRRKEILKSVLRQLHAGKPVEEVQAEFGALAQEAGSSEIAEIEQMLIDEGLPVEEIQNLCDVHVAVFRAGLDQQRPAETIPGHPIYTFRSENQVAQRMLDEMRRTIDQVTAENSGAKLQTFALQVEKLAEIHRHYLRKENLLFPYLEQYGFQGTLESHVGAARHHPCQNPQSFSACSKRAGFASTDPNTVRRGRYSSSGYGL